MGLLKLKPVVIFSILIGLAVPILLSSYYSNRSLTNQLAIEAEAEHQRIADVLALGVRKPMWDYAAEDARPLLLAYMSDESLCRISVFDIQGQSLLEEKNDARRLGEIVAISREIRYNDGVIGKLEVEFSMAKTASALSERTLSNFLIALFQVLFCASILALVINRRIIARLLRLSQEAAQLASRKLDQPFLWQDHDEIDHLGKSLEQTRISLQELFGNLETLVRERTAMITQILDNVASGFLLVNKELVIADGYSKSCETLFARTGLSGQKLTSVMNMKGREANHFQLSVDQVFEDMLPDDVTLAQVPSRIHNGDQAYSISGKAIKDADEKIIAVLFTITDASALERSEREVSHNRSIIKILQNIGAFRDFVEDTKELIKNAKTLISDQQKLRLLLHTLKGNLSVFGLRDIAELVHKTEDFPNISLRHIEEIENAIHTFLEENLEIVKISYTSQTEEIFEISKKVLHDLEKGMHSTDAVVAWIEDVQKVPVSSHLAHLPEYASRLAKQLGKKMRLEIEGADVKIDSKRLKQVLQNIVHLVRNAIDHGIEDSEHRDHKPEEALLKIAFQKDGRDLEIVVSDDGAGINHERIIAKALEQKLYTEAQIARMSADEVSSLIFVDGLSTANTLSEVSGRGIGMASVREAITGLKGSIQISSVEGQGTTFKIRIPANPH